MLRLKYLATRLVLAIPTFLVVLTLVFFVIRVIPGDPATAALGDYASQEAVEKMRERMGLNEPLYMQYFHFLGDLVQGDLGNSMITGNSINEQVLAVLPYTLQLTFASVLVGILLGVPTGIYTAVKRNSLSDYVGRILSLAGLSVPAFYLGILIMWLFALQWGLFPAVGGGDLSDPKDNLMHLVLPALTLGLIMTASVTRLTRSAMLNVLQEDYVRTARAKGLDERVTILRHALRAALVPIVSIIGIWTANLIADSVLTETVFARPGLGKMLVGAILQRDYTALQSVMVVYTGFIVVVNLITDLIYSMVDPRISH
ncbi:MAG TPA: ABC transporter permease [Chloroflexi bacterium]|nr:ABC transporter permease [Chloroflexota bacterium]